ncbi:MAG: hypothetical protein WCP19_06845 [Chloroflexota bacterium]
MIKQFFTQNIQRRLIRHVNNWRIFQQALRVSRIASKKTHTGDKRPVVFFKASSGIDDFSWNSAFHLLTSWALRLQGIPVVYFACRQGMTHCVLGTDRDNPGKNPPCRSCIYQSKTLYTGAKVSWFGYSHDDELSSAIQNLLLPDLMTFTFNGVPLGRLVNPGLRWILRRHNLIDDENTRFLLREYIKSAWNISRKFELFLKEFDPRIVVVFNGQFFPEAAARWTAHQHNLRVISHEVGLLPMTAFFTEGESTAYPINIPESFEMNEVQNARLDTYLQNRFQGNFSMAGVKFWPSIKGLDEQFLQKAAQFKQVIPVFTNVIFDTSQPHANTVFTDMFSWLDLILKTARNHPETLFVIRAHPDETRIRKSSLETVAGWVEKSKALEEPNILFVAPSEYLSSYELILRAKMVLIYNSTIGLEATIMGAAVLCAGKARFTQYPSVFFPPNQQEYTKTLEKFLSQDSIDIPAEFKRNARRFLYYQLFRTSLPFGEYLETGIRSTHARLKWFFPINLLNSPAIQTITKGLLENGDFLLYENQIK